MTISKTAAQLHQLVYYDDQTTIGKLLKSKSKRSVLAALTEQDRHGNTIFHLAAILGHSTVLSILFNYFLTYVQYEKSPSSSPSKTGSSSSLKSPKSSPRSPSNTSVSSGGSSGSPPQTPEQAYVSQLGRLYSICIKLFNNQRWSPFEEAIARGHRPTISVFVRLINLFQVAVALESSQNLKKAQKEKTIQKHDFSLRMKFNVSSWIPFISRFLPKDEITLHHAGGCFRLDFHIMPGDGEPGQMLWKIGNHSVIFNKSSGQKYAVALDHDKRRGEWIITEHEGRKNTPKMSNSGSSKRTLEAMYQARDKVQEWLCANKEDPIEPDLLSDVLHIDNAEISRQINMFMAKPVSRPGLSTHGVKFSQPSKFLGFGGSKSSTFGEFDAYNYTLHGLELVVRSRNEHLSAVDKERHDRFKVLNNEFKTGKKTSAPQVSGPESDMYTNPNGPDPIKEEDFTARLREMDNHLANCMNENRPDVEPVRGHRRPTYKEYIQMRDITVQLGHGRPISAKVKRHPVKGKISLAEQFPIQKESLLNMISAAAPRFRHFKRLEEFLKIKMPTGFPVNLEFPIWATISAQLQVLDLQVYRKDEGDESPLTAEMFSVPSDYVIIDKATDKE